MAIEPALLEQARAIAARRERSISDLFADKLRDLIGKDKIVKPRAIIKALD